MTLPAMASRYYPDAVQMPGPTASVYPDENACEGLICHSAEGDWSAAYKPTDTMIQRGVSWPFSIFKSGAVQQHFPISASCWHAGSAAQNRRLVGIEHEGKIGEPLTEAQTVASVALVRWIAQQAGWPDLARGVRLFEHREVNPATNCPSGRIPWGRYTAAPAPETLPGGEFLPEADINDVARFWAAVAGGNVSPDVEIEPLPAKRPGWAAWRVEVKQ